eukprot:Phypoly_transcript_09525.p1 GENE.Phypoly_transcript_09525~~Phypoly_transcript_09525.p1  ORF type:complete len:317 (+),score=58.39 Phypoly_transcript_09525:186-1136(+)
MGILWSKKGNQFEKALEKLEKDITHIEYRQRTAQTNKRKFVTFLIYFAVLAELLVVTWYYFHTKPSRVLDKVIDSYPLALPPIVGYILTWLVSFYYTRRLKSDGAKLVKLRSQLKQKLEERKQATDFTATQQLLSKYEKLTKNEDSPSSPPKVGTVPLPPQATGKKGQHPQPPPQQLQPHQQQPQPQQIRQRPTTPLTSPPSTAPPPPFLSPATRPPAPLSSVHPLPPPRPPLPTQRSWLDKLVDFVVGGEPEHSFALICSNCKAHNGLLPQSEMDSFQFRCRFCNHFNEAAPISSSTPSSSTNNTKPAPKSKKNE